MTTKESTAVTTVATKGFIVARIEFASLLFMTKLNNISDPTVTMTIPIYEKEAYKGMLT